MTPRIWERAAADATRTAALERSAGNALAAAATGADAVPRFDRDCRSVPPRAPIATTVTSSTPAGTVKECSPGATNVAVATVARAAAAIDRGNQALDTLTPQKPK